MDRSHARRYVVRHGYVWMQVRDPANHQVVNALPRDQALEVLELRRQQGFCDAARQSVVTGIGHFYLVRLVPDLDPNRVKLGFTTSLEARLAAHRTAAPTAELVRCWPCRATWEAAAIAAATTVGCRQIGPEVFVVGDVEAMRERLDAFFVLMPSATRASQTHPRPTTTPKARPRSEMRFAEMDHLPLSWLPLAPGRPS